MLHLVFEFGLITFSLTSSVRKHILYSWLDNWRIPGASIQLKDRTDPAAAVKYCRQSLGAFEKKFKFESLNVEKYLNDIFYYQDRMLRKAVRKSSCSMSE